MDIMSENVSCEYKIDDELIECNHCRNTMFIKGEAMLNTSKMTFLGLDWLNRTAVTLMCDKCGLIQWFGKAPIPKYNLGRS
jgi:predicted nucleic-acid-binding Zn-ribbon protein